MNYQQEEVRLPCKVTWAQMAPALPPKEAVGHVRARDLCTGWIRECMDDLLKCLLPTEEWPSPLPKATVWVENDAEWERVLAGGADRGVFGFLRREEVFHVDGEPLLLGLFGSPKK